MTVRMCRGFFGSSSSFFRNRLMNTSMTRSPGVSASGLKASSKWFLVKTRRGDLVRADDTANSAGVSGIIDPSDCRRARSLKSRVSNADLNRVWFTRSPRLGCSGQQVIDPQHQFLRIKGLNDVIVDAQLQGGDPVLLPSARRNDDYRHI